MRRFKTYATTYQSTGAIGQIIFSRHSESAFFVEKNI